MSTQAVMASPPDADEQIRSSLGAKPSKSFFLYAGAGSGKTGSLVRALQWLQENRRSTIWNGGRRVGVITYTNAATEEILRRTEFDPFISVSTIHSFAWELIGGFDSDIRVWLQAKMVEDIQELEEEQRKGRAGSKAAIGRVATIQLKRERMANLEKVRRFTYSPSGTSRSRESLNHTEVIGIAAELLVTKSTLQEILANRFPILFVDESQDTNKELMEALLVVQARQSHRFSLGLFGDTMQRIYLDGKTDLGGALPANWERPAKLVNYRCPARVLRLINKIRAGEDAQLQVSSTDRREGFARVFIAASTLPRAEVETWVSTRMSALTETPTWGQSVKKLILEHHMAANRLGFAELFGPLYAVDQYKTGVIDGSLPQLRFLIEVLLPTTNALKIGDRFRVAALARKYSPLLDRDHLRGSADPTEPLATAREATRSLLQVLNGQPRPSIAQVLSVVQTTGLFELPSQFVVALAALAGASVETEEAAETSSEQGKHLEAWLSVLNAPFATVGVYADYVLGNSPFGTHQGVKGLEFDNVMVIIDDAGARGFLFSYDKLFGLTPRTATDLKNEAEGKETTLDRTRRLLYVTCSRAKKSLAIVAYCSDEDSLRRHLLSENWFSESEIEIVALTQS